MGSKTPDGHPQGPNGEAASRTCSSTSNPPKTAAAAGLTHGTLEGQDEDDDDDEADDKTLGAGMNDGAGPEQKKKKRKRNKSNKKKREVLVQQQTTPPSVELSRLFRDGKYPEGEIFEYTVKDENLDRTPAGELRHLAAVANMNSDYLKDYRKAAEIHRQVRQHVQTLIKPGVTMSELAREIEDGVRALTGQYVIPILLRYCIELTISRTLFARLLLTFYPNL